MNLADVNGPWVESCKIKPMGHLEKRRYNDEKSMIHTPRKGARRMPRVPVGSGGDSQIRRLEAADCSMPPQTFQLNSEKEIRR